MYVKTENGDYVVVDDEVYEILNSNVADHEKVHQLISFFQMKNSNYNLSYSHCKDICFELFKKMSNRQRYRNMVRNYESKYRVVDKTMNEFERDLYIMNLK